jgi:hypothetical protein
MYEYDFNTTTEKVTMSTVNQANSGPSCALCGAVMVDESRMVILAHKFANVSINSAESKTVVKP